MYSIVFSLTVGSLVKSLEKTIQATFKRIRTWTWERQNQEQKAFQDCQKSLSSKFHLSCSMIQLNLWYELEDWYQDVTPLVQSKIGAVLVTHELTDGTTQPIAFASRSRSPAEKQYAQIDREGLTIIFGVLKFRQYLEILYQD